jgi:hypothetical protein
VEPVVVVLASHLEWAVAEALPALEAEGERASRAGLAVPMALAVHACPSVAVVVAALHQVWAATGAVAAAPHPEELAAAAVPYHRHSVS